MEKVAMLRKTDISSTAAGSRFGRYKREGEKSLREAEVVESEAMAQMRATWMAWMEIPRKDGTLCSKDMPLLSEGLRFEAKDVDEFMLSLEAFRHDHDFPAKAGMFISHLINAAQGESFVIDAPYLDAPLDGIGGQNIKHVRVIGAAGDFIGNVMKGGSLTLQGDAGSAAGNRMIGGSISIMGNAKDFLGWQMRGGEISVRGDTGHSVGWEMKGGKITIHGDAGKNIGHEMAGGEIHLEGGYVSISIEVRGGRIYHKGKLIVDK